MTRNLHTTTGDAFRPRRLHRPGVRSGRSGRLAGWVLPCVAVLAVLATSACSGGSQRAAATSSPSATATAAGPAGAGQAGATAAPTPAALHGAVPAAPGGQATGGAHPQARPSRSPGLSLSNPVLPSGASLVPGNRAAAGTGTGGNPSVTIGGITTQPASPVPSPSPPATCNPSLPPVQNVGITGVQTAHVAADGTIQPSSTFSSSTDRRIIIVVNLDPNVAVTGTVITFAQIFNCGYQPSPTYTLNHPLTYFYVELDASTAPFTPGTYRLRFFVNKVAAWDTSYQVT
jgi:hypothetical protein